MISIQQASVADIDALVRLRLDLLFEVGNLTSDDDVQRLASANRNYFTEKLPTGACVVWAAKAEDGIVGVSGMVRFERPPVADNLSGREGYVLNMYTVPAWRGQGIATAFLQEMIAYAKHQGIHRLWLHATPVAINVYQRAGFQLIAERTRTTAMTEMELIL